MYVLSVLSFYPLHFVEKSSAITIMVPQEVTWDNIKLYFVSI